MELVETILEIGSEVRFDVPQGSIFGPDLLLSIYNNVVHNDKRVLVLFKLKLHYCIGL